MSDFHSPSRAVLLRGMLDRLTEAADLRKKSKYHRAELDRIRTRLAALKLELALIEQDLKRDDIQE